MMRHIGGGKKRLNDFSNWTFDELTRKQLPQTNAYKNNYTNFAISKTAFSDDDHLTENVKWENVSLSKLLSSKNLKYILTTVHVTFWNKF